MTPRRRHAPVTAAAGLSILSALTLTLAACGSGSNSNSSTASTASTQPVLGGTLRLLGSSDVDHLDTASGYYTTTYTLERAFARQLFSYSASTDLTKASRAERRPQVLAHQAGGAGERLSRRARAARRCTPRPAPGAAAWPAPSSRCPG
jgi:hypothetical protein